MAWANNIKIKIDERIIHLANTLSANKDIDWLSSPNVKNALHNTPKHFVVVPIDKATGNFALVCKTFYASVISRELGLNNNSSTETPVSSLEMIHWQKYKRSFSPWSMVSFGSTCKISSYVVRAKLYPLDSVVGSTKCFKKRREVCMNVSETNTFTSDTYKINHILTCGDNCLIWLLFCKYCGKQYIGETTESFRYRWNNYKDNDRKHSCKETCMQEHLFNPYMYQIFLQLFCIKQVSGNPQKETLS